MEVQASLRLFGGVKILKERISSEAPTLGVVGIGWAPTALGALVLARSETLDLGARPLQAVLDDQFVTTLTAAAEHVEVLARIGIARLGQLRRLPRDDVSQRWGAPILRALDQAYGRFPETFKWEEVPEEFSTSVQLPAREDNAAALFQFAEPLLMQMCGWLAARHAGAQGFCLKWIHDSMRGKEAGPGGEVTIRTAEPMRGLKHFSRLLTEHLAKLQLEAQVGELHLEAVGVELVTEQSMSLLPESQGSGENITLLAERLAARYGRDCVLTPRLVDDHRTECAVHWSPAAKRKARSPEPVPELAAATILQAEPLRLAVRDGQPVYQGPLTLLVGPELVEGGWWDRLPDNASTRSVQRDYWVAQSETAGTLWIFCTQLDDGTLAWFLDGIFA